MNLSFTDNRHFKVVVLVCKEGDNSPYGSTVSFDGSSTGSTSLASSTDPTAAELCALGGATLSGVEKGNHSAAVTIP